MSFASPLPWWALGLLLISSVVLAWVAYHRAPVEASRRAALSSLRLISFLLLIVLIMRPVIVDSGESLAGAVVPVLVDTSRSMGIEDVGGGRRIDWVRGVLGDQLLPALTPHFQTEVLAFGEGISPSAPADLDASGRRSDIAGALRAVRERYRGRPVPGVVLLSDGGETTAGDRERDDGVPPVFVLGAGSSAVSPDTEVLSLTVAEAVLDDARIELSVSAASRGAGETIELRLLENGRLIDLRRTRPAADGVPVREVFEVAPPRGVPTIYSVETTAGAADLVPENNRRSVLVQPPSRSRRILIVQGAPGFEHTFLRRAWRHDPGLEIDSVVRKGRNDQGTDTYYIQAARARADALAAGFPQPRDALFAYDAVVLANVEGAALGRAALDMLREFVRVRGGGLLVLGAHSFARRGLRESPIEELLPVYLTEYGRDALDTPRTGELNRVVLTAAGESHPVMQLGPRSGTRARWSSLPALAAVAPLGGPRPGAAVLALAGGPAGEGRVLLAVQRYGEGRSMVFTGEASWRWRMQLPAADGSYETFWRQAARWLALRAADPVAVVAPAGAAAGEVVPLRILARTAAFEPLDGARAEVRITNPAGRSVSIPAAIDADATFLASYRPEEPGVYRVAATLRQNDGSERTASTAFLAGGADGEMTDPRLNLPALERIARASGGRIVHPDDLPALVDGLQHAIPAAVDRARASGRDVWHNGVSLGFIIGLLALEWILRRRWGLR